MTENKAETASSVFFLIIAKNDPTNIVKTLSSKKASAKKDGNPR